jgi:hypothetical protein
LVHDPPLPALEYVPGSHCVGEEVTDEEHLDPAGHVVHWSVAPFEYVPFPQVSWAVAPMGAFARWPGATVVQPVTYCVFCSAIGKTSQPRDRKESHWQYSLPENVPYGHSVHCVALGAEYAPAPHETRF